MTGVEIEEREPGDLGLSRDVLARFVASAGPLAVVDLETTGLQTDPDAEILELGAVLVDPGAARARTARVLVRPRGPVPRAVQRLTGIRADELAGAPPLAAVAPALHALLAGRTLVAHNAEFERHFLARFVDPGLGAAE